MKIQKERLTDELIKIVSKFQTAMKITLEKEKVNILWLPLKDIIL